MVRILRTIQINIFIMLYIEFDLNIRFILFSFTKHHGHNHILLLLHIF
jgi:hypothetical protein